ncbi:MAG: hypothetical protein JO157_05655, partial [Acetobacteraceae bacterium]|nr:hypothetical protein [Acetobacteraceae bacterium]
NTPTTSRRALLAGIPAAALVGAATVPALATAASPDAELIALCAQHIVNMNAYNRDGGHLEPEDDPLWHAYVQTRDAIDAAEPQTIEGILAKVSAAKAEAREPDGEDFDSSVAGAWAADVVNDLIRLSAGGQV